MTQPDRHDELARKLFEAARQERPSASVRQRAQLGAERDPGAIAIELGAAPRARHVPGMHYARPLSAVIALAAAAWLMFNARAPERDTVAITPDHASDAARAVTNAVRPVEPASAAPEPASEPAVQAPASAATAGHAAPQPRRAARPVSLAQEVALLDRARAALAAKNARRALALVDEYERVMLGTRLRAEAELLRIEALALSGQRARAAERARRFAIENPSSPLADRARALGQVATETEINGGRQ